MARGPGSERTTGLARSCHPMSGECSCQPGWAGLHCNESCPRDTHGPGCREHCLCLHGGLCQPDSGLCRCAPGYTVRRALRLDPGEAGAGGAEEPPLTSPPSRRLQGPHCASLCPPDTYGANCSSRCSCENALACSPIDGACICKEGNGVRPGRGGWGAGPRREGRRQGKGGAAGQQLDRGKVARLLPSWNLHFAFSSTAEIPLILKGPAQKAPLW